MKPYQLTLGQKRFLIVWIVFHSFALFVNVANINWSTEDNYTHNKYYWLTSRLSEDNASFWPFVTYITKSIGTPDEVYNGITFKGAPDWTLFNGIFYCYNFISYIFYIILGFGIVYVPKLWSKSMP